MEQNKTRYVWGLLRLMMGLIFLWAFLDKTFGWGFATIPEKSWLAGGSPTAGFLQFGVHGPFADFYHRLAGAPPVALLFLVFFFFLLPFFFLFCFLRRGGGWTNNKNKKKKKGGGPAQKKKEP